MFSSFIFYILPIFAIASVGLYTAVYFIFRRRTGRRPFARHAAICLFICCCASLIYLTILWYYPYITFDPGYYMLNLTPFIWISQTYYMGAAKMAAQLALNIAMFVPLGLLLPVVFARLRRFWKTAAVALAVTVAIETLQYFMGRSADIDDVIMNLAGGMLGYLLFYLANRWFDRQRWWGRLVAIN